MVQRNRLQINSGKTKELVVDFRRCSHPPTTPVNIQGKDIERVDSYKYLGVHLNNKLDWKCCPRMPLEHSASGGREEDGSKAIINDGQ